MKKKILSLLLAMALCFGLASQSLAAEAPAQTKAYTCDKILWIGPIPVAGLVTINNEYYVPIEVLKDTGRQCLLPISFYGSNSDNSYNLGQRFTGYSDGAVRAIKPIMCTYPGLELGAVTPSSTSVEIQDDRQSPLQTITLPDNVVYDLGGRYTMIRLRSMGEYFGYREDDEGIHICENPRFGTIPTVTWEEDLAGQAAKSLRVKDTKATLKAFHDYLVNNLSHEDFIDNAYFQKNDPNRHARIEQMYEKYGVYNNAKLASRWGVCQDYSELFQAMCFQAGIPCELVTSSEMNHAWNRVWLWGKWYHVDVTFDDPGPKPTIRQSYFLLPASKMMNTHIWQDSDCTYPEKYDPAWEKIDPTNLTTADQFRKCFIAQLVQGKKTFTLHPATAEAYGGYQGPTYWALNHAGLPGWGVGCGYKYDSKTKSYTFTVRYT